VARQRLYCGAAQLVNEIRQVGSLIQIKPTSAPDSISALVVSGLPVFGFTSVPFPGPTSGWGQSRRFDGPPVTSGPPNQRTSFRPVRLVRFVPIPEAAASFDNLVGAAK
jgi:hypothetical protein